MHPGPPTPAVAWAAESDVETAPMQPGKTRLSQKSSYKDEPQSYRTERRGCWHRRQGARQWSTGKARLQPPAAAAAAAK